MCIRDRLPTFILENESNELSAFTDSTPLIRRFEKEYPSRNCIPSNPVLSFLNYVLEDFADEWVTKYMFHYRWHFNEDAENAKKMLVIQHKLNIDNESLKLFGDVIDDRKINRLWVVGSNDDTAELIDKSYKRYLKLLEKHLSVQSFMFGERPSSSDFGLYGQLTQLVGFDPTPSNIAYKESPRTISWVNVMSDLSGLHNMGGVGEFFGIKNDFDKKKVAYFNNIKDACKNSDLLIIHTEWNEFKQLNFKRLNNKKKFKICLLYTSPSPRDRTRSRMPSSA